MQNHKYDLVAIGNAIVDVLAAVDDDFLIQRDLKKGSMSLISDQEMARLRDDMGAGTIASGGSAANTVAGLASLGGRGAYIGKVRDDAAGHAFKEDITRLGVSFSTPAATSGPPTAHCLIAVTPDGERTMSTYLGACVDLGPDDVDEALIADSKIFYFEGYLWDPPQAKRAFHKAVQAARKANTRTAMTLSDSFCVMRHRDELNELIASGAVDVLFANAHEITALYQTEDFDEAVRMLARNKILAFVTRSEKGCAIVSERQISHIPAAPIARLVDATGAGDLFAAGALYGLSQGYDPQKAGELGARAAAEVIQQFGARPERSLAELL